MKLLLKEKRISQECAEKLLSWRNSGFNIHNQVKTNPVTKKNFAIFTVLDWIATLTAHIPNKGEQMVRY